MRNIALLAAATLLGIAGDPAEAAPKALLQESQRRFVSENCGTCHGADDPEANFRVDDLPLAIDTVAAAERWQKVLGALNSGEMPPDEAEQPNPAVKADFLDVLATTMVAARKSLADLTCPPVRHQKLS